MEDLYLSRTHWLRLLESVRFEQVHNGINGRYSVLPQLRSLKACQEAGRIIKVPEVTNGGKPTVGAAPWTGQLRGSYAVGMGERSGSQTQRLWI